MPTLTILHNPRCSKSRQTLALIEAQGITPTIIKYLEQPPTAEELAEMLQKLGKAPVDIVRQGEDLYKTLGLAQQQLSDAAWVETLVANPKLIERPIVFDASRAIIGRPPENVLELCRD